MTTTPTEADILGLLEFLIDRCNQGWDTYFDEALKATKAAGDALPDDPTDDVSKIVVCTQVTITFCAEIVLAALRLNEPVAPGTVPGSAWHALTLCGERWKKHPGWKVEWANAALAALPVSSPS